LLYLIIISGLQRNLVGYDEDKPRQLEKALVLEDILSDLPAVSRNFDGSIFLECGAYCIV
jgi:hypothetical protein